MIKIWLVEPDINLYFSLMIHRTRTFCSSQFIDSSFRLSLAFVPFTPFCRVCIRDVYEYPRVLSGDHNTHWESSSIIGMYRELMPRGLDLVGQFHRSFGISHVGKEDKLFNWNVISQIQTKGWGSFLRIWKNNWIAQNIQFYWWRIHGIGPSRLPCL